MPTPEDELYLYLSVTAFSVSSVLVLEDSGTQRPVFYVSRVLHSAEIRYSREIGLCTRSGSGHSTASRILPVTSDHGANVSTLAPSIEEARSFQTIG